MWAQDKLEGIVADCADVAAAYGWSDSILRDEVLSRMKDAGFQMDLVDEASIDRLVAMYGEAAAR